MLLVSFIRHGESLDNLVSGVAVATVVVDLAQKQIWAGHKDAELSELGLRQAKALGKAYASTHLDAIITSDLKRAHGTALVLLRSQTDPKPSLKVDRDLREQYVGDAEGQLLLMHPVPNKSLADHFRDRQYPLLVGRDERFPNGECLNDVAARAERVIDGLLLKPYLLRARAQDVHIAVVSHGIIINEMIAALLRRNDGDIPTKNHRGLLNTGWTRVAIQVKPEAETPDGLESLPPLIVTVTDRNRYEHIKDILPKRQSIWEIISAGTKKKPAE